MATHLNPTQNHYQKRTIPWPTFIPHQKLSHVTCVRKPSSSRVIWRNTLLLSTRWGIITERSLQLRQLFQCCRQNYSPSSYESTGDLFTRLMENKSNFIKYIQGGGSCSCIGLCSGNGWGGAETSSWAGRGTKKHVTLEYFQRAFFNRCLDWGRHWKDLA